MPKPLRSWPIGLAEMRAYMGKAEEFLAAAQAELQAGRSIAATSLAIHAAINASDSVTGVRVGQRAAAQDHDEVIRLLAASGPDGVELAKDLRRLLPLKTPAEYDPAHIPLSKAKQAVLWAQRCVVVARRVVATRPSP